MDYSSKNFKIKEGFMGQRMITIPPNVLNEIKDNNFIKDFYTSAIGFYPQAIYHDRKRKSGSKEYILLYCIEGKGSIEIENTKYSLIPNSYIIIPPHIGHHYQSSTEYPWTIYWSHFLGSKADFLYKYYQENIEDNQVKTIARSERRQKDFIKIMTVLENGFEIRSLEFANTSLLNLLMQMIYAEEINPSELKTDIITKSIEYLHSNLNRNFKVEEIANQQNLSVSRYSELFKKKTGFSPVQYFNKLKIQKSCQYLYFTDMGIKEICQKIGYEDPYYYSRAFKKLMGMPPSRYRKEYKSQNRKN